MCGFAGLLNRASGSASDLQARVVAMADTLRHRGPDDDGCWVDESGRVAFAFRRLAILDLSSAGHQPMASPSGRYVIVFNGEAYNFQALRQELSRQGASFRGRSDTEVILAAFERWGIESTLPRLIGMFAIAVWDKELDELVLARDRLGIKPLYMARTAGGLAFGSELRAIMRAPGLDTALDPEAIASYLRYLYVPAPRTPVAAVRKIPPGHLLRVPLRTLDTGVPEPEPYWSLHQHAGLGDSVRPAASVPPSEGHGPVDALGELLSDAVRLRMIADVPVGALLSGGIDSSLVVALMQQHASQRVRTYTIGFDHPEHDESEHAEAVARHLGTDHTGLHVTDRDALDLVPSFPTIFDEPLANPSQIPTYLVSRLARTEVTVALAGDGGDELFAGYNRYASGLRLFRLLDKAPMPPRRLLAGALGSVSPRSWDRLHALFRPGAGGVRLVGQKMSKLARLLEQRSAAAMYRTLLSATDDPDTFVVGAPTGWDPIMDALPAGDGLRLEDMLLVDQRYYLPDDLLQKVDRASMAVSLEVRVPLLDHRIVEFSWTLPNEWKIHDRQSKWILRKLLYRHVPRALVERPKTGFTVPVESWLRGSLRGWAESLLLDPAHPLEAVFDRDTVGTCWRSFMAGRDEHALTLWAVLMFEAWRRQWSTAG